MTLINVHRFLIGTAILVCGAYGLRDLSTSLTGDSTASFEGVSTMSLAVGLAFYLRWIQARHRREQSYLR